eukprot:m.210511 g.210511  ORF g.210511 m.210511 type:complete len:137 (-) comp15051_c1_seq3:609-1019(-)
MIGTRLIEPCLDFLRDSQPWHSAARKTPARAKAKAAATSKSADGDGAESAAATSGTAAPAESESLTFPDHATNLSRNVVRIVANACAKCRECQDRVRELRVCEKQCMCSVWRVLVSADYQYWVCMYICRSCECVCA